MTVGKHLLLASSSPRRRELLSSLDTETSIVKLRDVDETYPDIIEAEKVPEYIACKKRDAYDTSDIKDNDILVTADTVVILDGKVLGKPCNTDDAKQMLRALSGKSHTVITGVTLTSNTKTVSFSTKTTVTFDTLSESQIDYYVERYKPLDKAGAYGIQEWIGYVGITGIEGCYYNVMGLPLHDLFKHLQDF